MGFDTARYVVVVGLSNGGGVLICDVECQCENGRGMWNWA